MANIGNLHLREYDAWQVLNYHDTESVLNRVWDNNHNDPGCLTRGDEPVRLTENGHARLHGMRKRLAELDLGWHSTNAELDEAREIFQSFERMVGFSTVYRAYQILLADYRGR